MTTPLGRPAEPIPFWAENDSYPAGTDPWSSTPVKVQPAVGVRNVGHEPKQQVPAQYENAIKSATARYIDYLVDMPFMNNSPLIVNDTSTNPLLIGYNGVSFPQAIWSEYHHHWIVAGCSTSGAYYFGDPALGFTQVTGIGASHWSLCCVAGLSAGANAGKNVFVCGDVAATIPYACCDSGFFSTSTGNLPGTSAGAFACYSITSQNRFIVVGSDNGTNVTIWKSDDYGTSWTKQTLSASSQGVNYRAVVGHNGEIVVISTDNVAGTPHAFYSSDNGNTWTTKTTGIPSGVMLHGFYYSSVLDAYVMLRTGDNTLFACFGAISNGFTFNPTLASNIIGSNVRDFIVIGNALYMETDATLVHGYRWLSWDLGQHARLVSNVYPRAATRLYAGPHSAFWTSTGSAQETLRTSGIGAVARAV